jgi:hypothetical protein
LLPESAVVEAASLAQAVREERASRPAAASAEYLAVLRMMGHVLVRMRCGKRGALGSLERKRGTLESTDEKSGT